MPNKNVLPNPSKRHPIPPRANQKIRDYWSRTQSAIGGSDFLVNPDMQNYPPWFIAVGLGIVLAAQLWTGVPVAAAIALIGFGSTSVIRRQRWRLCGTLLVYAALVGLAIGAELHLRFGVVYLFDALLAVGLLLSATQLAVQRIDSASTW